MPGQEKSHAVVAVAVKVTSGISCLYDRWTTSSAPKSSIHSWNSQRLFQSADPASDTPHNGNQVVNSH